MKIWNLRSKLQDSDLSGPLHLEIDDDGAGFYAIDRDINKMYIDLLLYL